VNAKRDGIQKMKNFIEKDRVVLNKIRKYRDPIREIFEAVAKSDTTIKQGPQKKLGLEKFCQDLLDKKLISDIKVSPIPPVAGQAVPEFHVALLTADAKQCFVAMGTGDVDADSITFDEFMVALCLCATFKYAEVKVPTDKDPDAGMDLAMQCVAVCKQYAGTHDEQAAITDALFPPVERFDVSTSGAEEGFVGLWEQIDLSGLYGFPLWEEAVFNALYAARAELQSIFTQYANSGKGGKTDSALTMEQKELTDLALDCSLATPAFPMEKVVAVFESADAIKDEKKAAKGVKADGSLELHEFMEAMVKVAFARDNPDFGEGKTDPSFVPKPLPGCLEAMLKDNLLLNAKRDALAGIKAQLVSNAAAKQIIAVRTAPLKRPFEKLAASDPTTGKDKKSGPAVGIERFCQELFDLGVAKEVIVSPVSPIKGKTLPDIRTNLTMIDCKGAFVSSQKVEKKNSAATVNLDEFVTALALCGAIKYAEVKDADGKPMPLAAMIDGVIANYLDEADEGKVINKLYPPPPRFNPAAPPAPGKAAPAPSFMAAWKLMDLSHLWGFPTFEAGVFELLNTHFAELNSIFTEYSKSGTAGASSMSALLTIQSTEFTTFALDCGITTDKFPTSRLNAMFLRADQVDEKKKVNDFKAGDTVAASADEMTSVGQGDHGLTFPEFMEALCACALYRANPDLGEHGQLEAEMPLPECLETLLKNQILTNAKRDKLALVKSALETDADVLAMLPELKKRLQTTTPNTPAAKITVGESRSFDDVTKVGVRKVFGKQVMSMEILQDELTARRVAKDIYITPTPKVKGDAFPQRHCNLSWLDCKGAFTTAQFVREGRDTAETDEGNETIDFDEFVVCLGLMGHIKYLEIEEMTLADRLLAITDNWLLTRDEQAVIDDHCVPPPPRYDFKTLAKPLKGQDEKEHTRLLDTYAKMDLSHVFGFPLWEEATFGALQRSFPELVSIFNEYSKTGSAGSGSAKAAMTLQSTELTNLALDCELATDKFKMARINMLFMRADQVDDTLEVDRSDKRKTKGKGAEAGDKGLELHEFLECLVMLAFQRANPDMGNVGENDKDDCDYPLPGCLESLLEKNILKNARRDKLAKVKKIVEKDPSVIAVKDARREEMSAQFEIVCKKDATTLQGTGDTGSTLGMDVFCDELSDRVVSEDKKATPTPNITGLFLPPVHTNLSWLDCKGAFVTCQSGAEMETIDLEEFLDCLALCGTIKYEKVKGLGGVGGNPPGTCPEEGAEMPLAMIVDGIYANFLMQKDAHAVITEFQQPTLPRFDYANSGAQAVWIACYSKMNLSHVYGFPLWEEAVFKVLGAAYNELKLIFQQYAKTGTAGSSTAEHLYTMQKTELTNLSLDCSLATADFSQARVTGCFERANTFDDAETVKIAGKKVARGKTGEKGDIGLQLHEFMECLVLMAFQRANPKHGQVGKSDGTKNDLITLPTCLETLLSSCILQKAKRDQAPMWLAEIVTSGDVRTAIEARRNALRVEWRKSAGKGEQGSGSNIKSASDTGLQMTIDDFIQNLLDRGLMKDVTLPPRPPVVGMAVEKVHLNLSALDIKGAFIAAQDADEVAGSKGAAKALEMGEANHTVGFEEFIIALALCGHIKYAEVKGSTMADRVAGAIDNYLPANDTNKDAKGHSVMTHQPLRSEREVISNVLYPPPPRTMIADTAGPLSGQPKEQHQLFIATWKEAMRACLEIDVIGFPVWEESVFKIVQEIYGELSAVFSHYAQSIAGGSLQSSTLLTVTLQDNELASFCRDTGLLNEHFTIARVQSLFKDVSNAFSATRTVGSTAAAGQGGGSGVYSEGIHLPAFIVLLLLMALNRSNPKLGRVGEAGEQAVDQPLPGCFSSMLEKHVLKKAKRNKMTKIRAELLAADPKTLFAPARAALEKAFNATCKKREKMPAVSLFAKFLMSRATFVADLKERGIIIQKNVKAKPKVTGDAAAAVELSLAPLDVESAFTLCQAGGHGDAANETIEFDEFLVALGMCGAFKYSEGGMSIPQRVEAILSEYLGQSSAEAALEAAAPKPERYDPSSSGADAAFITTWTKMDLSSVKGFPIWEEDVFFTLSAAFTELSALFTQYAGDTPGMQQAELVSLAMDYGLPTPAYTITMIVALFDRVNKESGAGDSDLELFEFLAFLVILAFARNADAGVNELATIVDGLKPAS